MGSNRHARWVLSFDFDGTLHDPASEPPVPLAFFDKIGRLVSEKQAVWGVNTGRSLEYALEGMRDSGFPLQPDWIVAREREIYLRDADGCWQSYELWNHRCTQDIHELFEREQAFLSRIRREVLEHTGAEWLQMDGEPAGVISRTEEEMEWIVGRVEELVNPQSNISWQRNTIYLRFSHGAYHKGSALSEVARLFGVLATHCLAIGDSHNDI